LKAHVSRRESERAKAQAEQAARSKEQQDQHAREVADHAGHRQQQREERERSRQQATEREAAHLRFLGPEGRKRELVTCYEQHALLGCADTALKLFAATADERERRAFVVLNEKLMQQQFKTASEPVAGQLLCCDGSVAATCTCGPKLKNCCTGRGGTCGCTPASATSAAR
jgi:hypothetical protein